jgi:hypothetical protein
MRGKLIVFDPNGKVPIFVEYDRPVSAGELQGAVGGYIETVPYFDTLLLDGKRERCVAFCNEEGKLGGLPMNEIAQALWADTLAYQGMTGVIDDYLVGPIAVVIGDQQFMDAL